MNYQKEIIWRSAKYLDWVRSQPCYMTMKTREEGVIIDPHHIKGIGHFSGVGQTAPDYLVMPLSREKHELVQSVPALWPLQFEMIVNTLDKAIREGALCLTVK